MKGMHTLRRRIFLGGCLVLLVAGGTGYSLYGAYRLQGAELRAADGAAGVAGILAPAWEERLAQGQGSLETSLSGAAGEGPLRSIRLLGRDGTLVFSAPKELSAGPSMQQEPCRRCHGSPPVPPPQVAIATESGRRIAHVYHPLGPSKQHLTLAFDVTPVFASTVADLQVAGLCALAAGLVSAATLWWGLGAASRAPAPAGEAVGSAAADGQGPSVEPEPSAATLDRLLAYWESAGAVILRHLGELKLGAQQNREVGREVLRAAETFRTTMGDIRNHLNGIAGSTSDNSTSLIEMSASVDEVASSADQLAQHVASSSSAVLQMVQSIGEVADRVGVLAKETDSTASSMAQIDASTKDIEVNAREATALSGHMAEAATDGSRAVQETLEGIHSSYEVIQETARAMDELKQASGAIGGVVKIINEINDKTKLLSLNAAIIAAQAGEHGKSFAVVAHEIKNLSDRTSASTGEISRLIRGIRERMTIATEAVARGKGATGRSVDLAEKAGEALQHILRTSRVSHEMIHKILQATEEQSRGSQKVMKSMGEVGSLVTYVRQAALEHRSSGESVSASAELMRDLTEQVKLATAEQAEVSRYISEAITAIDRNLRGVVQAVDAAQFDTEKLLESAHHLAEQGETGALEIQSMEEHLLTTTREMQDIAIRSDTEGTAATGDDA